MDCELNSLTLPIITEMGHLTGDCYCYLCTCGLHQCPSTTSYRKSSKNQFKSLYRSSYLPKRPTSLIKYIRSGEIIHSKQKMDFTTTQRHTYQTINTSESVIKSSRSATSSPFTFSTNSTYRANYPD